MKLKISLVIIFFVVNQDWASMQYYNKTTKTKTNIAKKFNYFILSNFRALKVTQQLRIGYTTDKIFRDVFRIVSNIRGEAFLRK